TNQLTCPGNCSNGQWMCFNRRCIDASLTCNAFDDCGDGSDETYLHARCPPGEMCDNMMGCFKLEEMCDGQNDCADGSDEHNCRAGLFVRSFVCLFVAFMAHILNKMKISNALILMLAVYKVFLG
ncbi:hypothetical protein HELRODRAFT_65864, partial [Helobdella robusta]|uniref:Uncharacterized protein n=1 Tax=Helobdella robusta TaxID=6412 RepID=T1FYD9_HELRO